MIERGAAIEEFTTVHQSCDCERSRPDVPLLGGFRPPMGVPEPASCGNYSYLRTSAGEIRVAFRAG